MQTSFDVFVGSEFLHASSPNNLSVLLKLRFAIVGENFTRNFFRAKKMTHIESYLRESAGNSRNLALVRNRIRKAAANIGRSKIFGDTNQ